MSDESTNPVGTTQTSQNNQTTTNQTGNDDFVLNFGDEEKKEETKNNEGINNLDIDEKNTTQDSNQEIENENNINLDDDNLFGEEEEEKTESEEINIQNLEDEEKKEPINEEFNVSLDNEAFSDNSENDSEGILESKNEKTDGGYMLLEEDKEEVGEKIEDEEMAEKIEDEEMAEKIEDEEVGEKIEDEEMAEKIEDEEVGEKIEDEEVEEKIEDEEMAEKIEDEEMAEKIEDEAEEPEETIEENLDNDVDNPEVSGITEEKDEEGEQADDDFTISMGGDSDEVSDEDLPETQNNTVEDNIQNDNSNDYVANFTDDLSEDSNDTLLENKNTLDDTNNTEELPGDEMKIEDESVDKDDVQEDIFSDSDLFQKDIPENDNNTETKDSLLENDTQQEPKIQDIQTKEKNFNNSESIEDSDTTLRDNNLTEKATDEENALENTNSVVDYSLSEKQPIKQPEIGDLLGKSPVDFSKVLSDGIENNQNINLDDKGLIVKNQESDTGNFENLNQGVENLQSNIAENPDFTMDYSESNQEVQSPEFENNGSAPIEDPSKNQGDTQNLQISESGDTNQNTSEVNNGMTFVSEENNSLGGQLNNNQNSQMQENVDKINEVIYPQNTRELSNRPVNNEGTQEITSTLSLDQILDSELNSNPQFTDNSQAVAKNVQKSSGLLANKKMIGIISGILIFLLAGFVFVMAFPSKSFNRKIGDVAINTQDEIEEIHNSGSDDLNNQDLTEEYEVSDTESEKQLDETTDTTLEEGNKTAGSSVQVFPDAEIDEGDEILDENTPTDIEPYICIGNDCEKESNITSNTMTIEEKKSVISDFKSYAQEYYNLGDETQDKKLVRYAAQIMYLCDNYQEQLENGEGNNQESFENFESKVSSLKDKMIKYFGSINDIGNLNGDSKADYEEVKNYINARANEMN